MLEKALINIGLNEKQAKIYLALLELGRISVQDLAKRAKIKRATTYVILDELKKMSLVKNIKEGKKKFFVAEQPENFLSIFEKKRTDLEEKINSNKALFNNLKIKYNKNINKNKVKYFEGEKGVMTALQDITSALPNTTTRVFYNADYVVKIFQKEEIIKYRTKKNIKAKAIYISTKERFLSRGDTGIRIRIKKDEYFHECDIAIYGDKIRIASFASKNPFAVIIQDDKIAQALVSLFELAWQGAKIKDNQE